MWKEKRTVAECFAHAFHALVDDGGDRLDLLEDLARVLELGKHLNHVLARRVRVRALALCVARTRTCGGQRRRRAQRAQSAHRVRVGAPDGERAGREARSECAAEYTRLHAAHHAATARRPDGSRTTIYVYIVLLYPSVR